MFVCCHFPLDESACLVEVSRGTAEKVEPETGRVETFSSPAEPAWSGLSEASGRSEAAQCQAADLGGNVVQWEDTEVWLDKAELPPSPQASPTRSSRVSRRSVSDPSMRAIPEDEEVAGDVPEQLRAIVLGDDAARQAQTQGVGHEVSYVQPELDPTGGLRRPGSVQSPAMCILDAYTAMNVLGEGSFGTVWMVQQKQTKELLACKTVPSTSAEDSVRFEAEADIARKLKHPHIVEMREVFRDERAYHLVMELCSGGTLMDRLQEAGRLALDGFRGFPGPVVACYLWQMLSGLAYLHHYKVAHRDIKAENYLLLTSAPDSPIKLGDFGLARTFCPGEDMTSNVGTPSFMAPEVVECLGYNERCDIWSVGALTYLLAVGRLPFTGLTEKALFTKIVEGNIDLKGRGWERHPPELKDVIVQAMTRNPAERPSAEELLASSSWLQQHAFEAAGDGTPCCCLL